MKKIVILLLFISQFVTGQNAVDFESEDYYYIQRSQTLKISLKKGVLDIKNKVFEQAKYNSVNNLLYANDYIHFDSFTEIDTIEAYTETATEKIKVDHYETKDQFGGGIFFSDQQSINFVFPAVAKNAITTLKYTENIKDPHFLGSFRFGTYVPTKEAIYTVEVPKGVELGYKAFNLDQFDISFDKKETRKTTIYTWKASNIQKFRKNENSLSILNYLPHVIVYIKSYENKKEKTAVLSDVSELYDWYASLVQQVDTSNLKKVFDITDEVVKNAHTDSEKTKAIFHWVQDNITYVAFEDGLGGFIPRGAASVCNKRYGDCKDMANLLFEMLNHVGIEAYRTWIGTRDRPYSYYEVPTPIVDNHMISVAIIDGETIFLDATDSYVPYGMPSSFIQSKEALIGISKEDYKIIKVPEQPKEKNTSLIETTISLDGNILKATEKRTLKGYEMVDLIYDLKFRKEDKTDEEYLNNKYKIGNNKTVYTNIHLGDMSTKNEKYTLNYDLEIRNYSKSMGSKIFLNLNLEKPLVTDLIIIKNQQFGKNIDHKFIKQYSTTFKIPEGYTLKAIPKNISNEKELYGYSFSYKLEGNQLILDKQVYVNTLTIQNEQFEAYNTFIKGLIKAYKKSITLIKI